LSATGPGNAGIKVDGKAGPIDQADTSLTPLSANLDVQHLDLATTGFIDPSSGLGGVLDFKGDLNSDGKDMKSQGSITINKFKMSAAGSPSSVPVKVDYATDYTLKTQAGVLSKGDIHIGSAFQQLTGTYNLASDPAALNMKVNASNMPLNDLEGFLPAVGVVLPSGSKLQGGTLSANLSVSGPTDKLTIAGPVNIANTELAGFSLSQKLGALSAFTGLGKGGGGSSNGTQIQQLSAQIKNDPSGTQFSSLNLVIPSLGSVTGQGTVSASGQLNMHMVANLAGAAGALTSVAGMAGGAAGGGGALGGALGALTGGAMGGGGGKGGSNGIPFSITGTTSNPQVVPDVAGMAGNLAKGGAGMGVGAAKGSAGAAGAAAGALGGLLGGKKKP
jgi:AsmA protein